MPLPPDIIRTIGFTVPRGQDRPNGTCFLVRIPSSRVEGHAHVYVVTASHCVPSGAGDFDVWLTDGDGKLEQGIEVDWQHNDEWDVAVAPWFDEDSTRYWSVPDLERVTYTAQEIDPHFGAAVYYGGLLTVVPSLGATGTPMIRTAHAGAFFTPDVTYGKQKPRTLKFAHLVDTRSYAGFSGSPCWIESSYSGALQNPDQIPKAFRMAEKLDPPDWVGNVYSFVGMWGMLVGYSLNSPHEVGVVVPIEIIEREIRMHPELNELREEGDEKESKRREEEGLDAISSSATEAGYQRQDFLDDLRAVTRRTDSEKSDPEA